MMPNKPLRAVVFDLDGLMFNTEALYEEVGGEVLRRRGKAFDVELLNAMMGRPSPDALRLMIDYHQLEDSIETLAAESETVFEGKLEHRLETMPGLCELLDALERSDLPKGIATSSGRRFAQLVLGKFDLEPRFQFVLTAENIVRGKPDPEVYHLAAERLGVPVDEILVLEDSANGSMAAVAAGAYTIAVPSGHSHGHDLSHAAFVADSLADPRIYRALGLDAP